MKKTKNKITMKKILVWIFFFVESFRDSLSSTKKYHKMMIKMENNNVRHTQLGEATMGTYDRYAYA